jgi:hypothetical protein
MSTVLKPSDRVGAQASPKGDELLGIGSVQDPTPGDSALGPKSARLRLGGAWGTSSRNAAIAFGLLCLAASAVRFAELYGHGRPTGLDLGNWLAIGHFLLGQGLPDGSRTLYPPLVPLVALGLVRAFGLLFGWALLATTCAALPGLAAFWVLRRRGSPWVATAGGTLLLCTSSTGEASAWGGFPQLVGLGFGLFLLAAFDDLLSSPDKRRAWKAGGWLFGLAATSHLVLAQMVPVLAVLMIVHVARTTSGQRRELAGKLLRLAPRVLLPSLPLVPLYWWLAGNVGASFLNESGGTATGGPGGLLTNLWVIYRDSPVLWTGLLAVTVLAPLLTWRSRKGPLWPMAVALVVGLGVQLLVSSESRLVYLVPMAVVVAIALVARDLASLPRPARWGAKWIGAGCLGALAALGLAAFPSQIAYYGTFVPPGTVPALDWIAHHTPSDELMLVAPIDGVPFGWWVEGYARRPSLVGSAPQWLNVPRERTRAGEATKLLTAKDVLAPANLASDRKAGVSWLVLPKAWGGVTRAQLSGFQRRNPHATVYQNEALVVLNVPR